MLKLVEYVECLENEVFLDTDLCNNFREKNLEKMEALIEKLKESSNFEITSGIHAIIMDTNAACGHLEKALEELDVIKKMEGDEFELDESKIVRLAGLLVKNGKLDDAIKLLEGNLITE